MSQVGCGGDVEQTCILLLSFVILLLLSDRRGLWEQLFWRLEGCKLIIKQFDIGQGDLRGSTNIDWVASQICVGQYLGGRRMLHFMCRVDFGVYGWAGTCVRQFCCVPPGTFSPWRLRYREADRCSLPTQLLRPEMKEMKMEYDDMSNDMRKRICVLLILPILPSVERYSSLDRFSWYPINVLGSLRRWHGYYCLLGLYDCSIAHMIFAQCTDQTNERAWRNARTMLWYVLLQPEGFRGAMRTLHVIPKGRYSLDLQVAIPAFRSWAEMQCRWRWVGHNAQMQGSIQSSQCELNKVVLILPRQFEQGSISVQNRS
jgi:hypothetical protein